MCTAGYGGCVSTTTAGTRNFSSSRNGGLRSHLLLIAHVFIISSSGVLSVLEYGLYLL